MSFTLWFTGIPCSGKTTISRLIYKELQHRNLRCVFLDGNDIRSRLNNELGFDRRDRNINVYTLGYISYLLNENNIISIVASISPYRNARYYSRQLIKNYIEIYCSCSLVNAIKRDNRRLYEKALNGLIPNFTGITDPYEEPTNPEIIIKTDKDSIEMCTNKILIYLKNNELIPTCSKGIYNKEAVFDSKCNRIPRAQVITTRDMDEKEKKYHKRKGK